MYGGICLLLEKMTWEDIEAYLKKRKTIIIPLGTIEQHGFHGTYTMDIITSYEISKAVGDRLGIVVLPPIYPMRSDEMLNWPGSITVRLETFLNLIEDVITSLYKGGFRVFYMISGHGDVFAIQQTIKILKNKFPDITIDGNLYALVSKRVRNEIESIFNRPEGVHANFVETSLTMYLKPSYVYLDRIKFVDDFVPWFNYGSLNIPIDKIRERFPSGAIGSDPRLSSKEIGEKLFNVIVEEICKIVLNLEKEYRSRKR